MPSPPSPSLELRKLLETKVDSIEKLELVLMLRDAATSVGMRDIADHLQVGSTVMRRVVEDAVRVRLVALTADDQVRLLIDELDADALDEAARLYTDDRPRMMALFASVALDRIRSMAARNFADAFSFRKKKKGDDHG